MYRTSTSHSEPETVSNFFISARYCDNQLKSSDRMINSVGAVVDAYGSRTQKSVLTIGRSHDGGLRHRFGVHLGYPTAFMLQVSCSEIRKIMLINCVDYSQTVQIS